MMIIVRLDDKHVAENIEAIAELRESGLYTDEELQEMYNRQVKKDREAEEIREASMQGILKGLSKHNEAAYNSARTIFIEAEKAIEDIADAYERYVKDGRK